MARDPQSSQKAVLLGPPFFLQSCLSRERVSSLCHCKGFRPHLIFKLHTFPNSLVCPLEAACRPNRGQRIHRPSVPIQPLAPFEKTRTMHHPTFHAFKSLTAQTLLSAILTLTCQAAEGFTDTPMQPNGSGMCMIPTGPNLLWSLPVSTSAIRPQHPPMPSFSLMAPTSANGPDATTRSTGNWKTVTWKPHARGASAPAIPLVTSNSTWNLPHQKSRRQGPGTWQQRREYFRTI